MMTEAPRARHERTAPALCADSVADAAGGLTFDIGGTGDPGPAHLVLRRRDGEEVALPLAPAESGRLRAALPSSVELPEGRWEAYAQFADGEPRRLVPGVNDLRSLGHRVPGDMAARIAVRIPYTTREGTLAVRSWLRAPHAEAGDLRIDGGELRVSGRVYGTGLAPEAYAEVRARGGRKSVLRADVTARETEFGFTVPYAPLAPGIWDLWLRPAGERGPRVRIARLLDDVADKRPVFRYPKAAVRAEHGEVEARPYYTVDNDLSVTVSAVG
ncbi:hypothetical protein AAW14_13145 [Streptomyces hygroscopicus]|uniref:hypothetical protein n=1 Tax=Streptomyces hygroscopicus TaxID=1912 RepID=UPI00223E8F5F|nr:hypothetical protein [Streptomyces hygroscopicus]MCW7942966.1 hypothetical protein [Streptomyces hygroscopicus]